VDRLARRLRAARRVCRTVTLRMRFDDFSRATRSHTLPEATAQTQTILATARGLLAAASPTIRRQGLTLVGVSLANLHDDDAIQLALPFDRHRAGALDATLDELRDRLRDGMPSRRLSWGRCRLTRPCPSRFLACEPTSTAA
jgi:DNA polymerase-4